MSHIADFLIGLGHYTVPAILLFAEFILAIVLLGGFFFFQIRNRKAARNLKNFQLYHQILSENSVDAHILMRRSDFCPVFVTDNIETLFHISAKQLKTDVELLYHLSDKNTVRTFLTLYRAWDGNSPLCFDFATKGANEWFTISISRSSDALYDLISFHNITENRQKQNELEEKWQNAQEESKYKTTFLSRMSHEIRTPMNGIVGMLQLAQNQLSSESLAASYLAKAEKLSQYLLSIINDILDFSRIEANRIELENRRFDLFAFADKMRNMFQKNIEAKGVDFRVELLDFDVRYIIGDELRLSQIIVNFLSNAMKFTSEGEIVLTIRQMIKSEESVDIMFRVHDTGVGMEPSFISRIFRPFEQEDASVSRKYGGSGLGMAITDRMVELMGGKIVINSLPGQGSDFIVYLKFPIAQDQGSQETDSHPHAKDSHGFTYEGLRILLAEDNEVNAEIAVSILKMKGAVVEVASNGQQAVDAFNSHPANYYDLILMDVQMPIMDGREAAKRIRALPREDASSIAIFALSADAFVEDRNASIAAGMDGHFPKPIDFDQLQTELGDFFYERNLETHRKAEK